MLISVILGLLIGYFYGLGFVYQQSQALFNTKSIIINSYIRFAILLFIVYYLLHLKLISPILFFTSFLITFWVIILTK